MAGTQTAFAPANAQDRTRNPLRPQTFNDVIGQHNAVAFLRRAVGVSLERQWPLDHTLFIAPSGTGKSTLAHVIANELGVACYDVEAPVSFDSLLELRDVMRDGDLLKIEEIHQQGVMERRGRSTATQPEVLYGVMEDRVLLTERGPLPYPFITLIGTTTDEGMLPDAFINRFPLRPRLERYRVADLTEIAVRNAATLGAALDADAAQLVARASRGVPREVNNLIRNSVLFAAHITASVVREVLEMNALTEDGLTADMQAMLTFLYTRAQHRTRDGDLYYQASVNTIATAIGKSRDSKAVALRVEPFLIEQGLVQVGHGGRQLTDAGVARARELAA